MKIYFIRHGEAMDDIKDEYGGWHDPDLSPRGLESGKKVGKELKGKGINIDTIYTSPLKRAFQTAELINESFGLSIETLVYLKERNTYGLLCGVNKEEAKEKYPELVEVYSNDLPVYGYEPYPDFLERVKQLVKRLSGLNHDSIICVTHGKLLKALTNDIMNKQASKFGDNCILEVDLDDGSFKYIDSKGIVFN